MASEYMTVTQARKAMQISEGKIASMIRNGELTTIPNPRNKSSKLIPRQEVAEWVKKFSIAPPAERRRGQEEQAPKELLPAFA
jgi:excisionase family DNA binding protein